MANEAEMCEYGIEFLKRQVWIAARNGQADRIVELLWKVDRNDVNEILNNHTEEDEQSTTPLIIAACKGHEEVVDILLIFCVDIEQKGTIVAADNYTFHGATALWCAACWGHYNIVKILVRNGANVNNPTETGSKPLGSACFYNKFKIVQYLVEHGADINNATYIIKDTSLINACSEGYYDMVQYLLEKGADPECATSEGKTALHEAACSGHLAISKLLVETGLTMTKDNDGLTPLMMAAVNGKSDMVEYLSTLPECSREDRIDALELLGTSFLFKTNSNISKAYRFFKKAMQERFEDPDEIIQKNCVPMTSIIIGTAECISLHELEEIRDDELALSIEALAIQERILGPSNVQLHDQIFHIGNVLADMDDFDKCIDLWLYGSDLKQKHDKGVDVIRFPQLFAVMFHGGIKIKFSSLLESFKNAATEVTLGKKRIQNGNTSFRMYYKTDILACIDLVGIMLLTYTSKEDENQLYRAVYGFIRQKPHLRNGFTPLHMCCDSVTNDNNIDVKNVILFPNILLCKTLVACGANVNAQDRHNDTPLHVIAKCRVSDFDILREIITCLIENGAHFDARNKDGKTAVDVASTGTAKGIIKAHTKLSLKCLSATAIKKHKLKYQYVIPASLYEFVELH